MGFINLGKIGHAIEAGFKNVENKVENAVVNKIEQGAQKITDTFEHAAQGVAGKAVAAIGSVLPSSGNDKQYDGQYVGAGGKTFPPGTPLSDIPAVKPSDGRTPNETIIFTNGIATDKDSEFSSLQAIADKTGAQVIGVHNATEGAIKDLAQCISDKEDKGTNPAVDTLANTIYSELKAGHDVHLMGHSQGGLITARALFHVQQRLQIEDGMSKEDAQKAMSHIKCETFGAASAKYPDGPEYVHYINRSDAVPNLFGLGENANGDPNVHPGAGAKIEYFKDGGLTGIVGHNHSFNTTYLEHRIPFDSAYGGAQVP